MIVWVATAGMARGAVTVTDGDSVAATATPSAEGVTSEPEAGGTHLRLSTPAGPVHVFRPGGYDRRTAGVVVYVHGYYVDVDGAWRDHHLAEQFAASHRNALFIAPEAPAASGDHPVWPRLRRLLAITFQQARLPAPRGPLVVAGHSAAYRTIVPWLTEPALHHLILIDALYGKERDFRAWLKRNRANHLTLATRGTAKWANPFLRSLPGSITARRIPDHADQLTRGQRKARVLALRSQYGHFELITEGKALPVLLGRPPLPVVRPADGTRPRRRGATPLLPGPPTGSPER
jgi:hypothetical protein